MQTETGGTRAVLHHVLAGRCRLSAAGVRALELAPGDLALLPTGARHHLTPEPAAAPDTPPPAVPDTPLPTSPPGPPGAAPPRGVPAGPAVFVVEPGGAGAGVRVLTVRTGYGRPAAPPLAAALPRALRLDRARVEAEPLLRDTLALLAAPGRRPGPGDRLLALRVLETALGLAAAPRPPDGPYHHPGIGRAIAAIETRYAEPWTVVTLAREAGMSRSAFTAAFREAVGTPPARRLTARRIREAARLLAETGLPQSAVPARVGYRSRVGFHLAFRTAYGMTPGEYRAAAPRRV
ncbi:AraC family transcriptional regulator [Streptomyces sp. NRRL F-5727]|uniref:AraC family transcriptional regulator n=1 Tax=Streptomyces sp. NRRL F-5727 TaxID=1463871 RepID=UPI00068E3694|nr:AraC family transcriptional regulator [Streptomyces sp. NRRL F-5727]